MPNITILQADNRPQLNYLLLTQEVNKKVCDYFGYKYLFVTIDNDKYTDLHPATKKIHVVNDFLNDTTNRDDDILIFLDSDAWVQNCFWLNEIIETLKNNENKHGCFSRDPYQKKNTFINSGSFILKINAYTKQMYSNIIQLLENDEENFHYKKTWPYDQFYISNFVFNNKEEFYVFVPDILNTPIGKVLRHNWQKTRRMFNDLELLKNSTIDENIDKSEFNLEKYLDICVFPNVDEYTYEYEAWTI